MSLRECFVCSRRFPVEVTRAGYAFHLRTHAKESYEGHPEVLASLGLGLCERGGEARALSRGRIYRHKRCDDAQLEERVVEEVEECEEAEWEGVAERSDFEGLPWPEAVPFPPCVLAHPFDYSNEPVVRKVPVQCLSGWAEVVRRRWSRGWI